MDPTGKVALVTGAAVRVGKQIALALAERGYHLAVHYNASAGPATETVEQIRALGVEAHAIPCDLTDTETIPDLIEAIEERWRRLDVVVNSAAIFPRTPWSEIDEATWDEALDVNLKAPFFVSRHAARLLGADGGGSIVHIADWAALRPYKHYLPYLASKGGVVTMTKAMAKELAPGIRVNAVAPGPVMLPEDMSEEVVDHVREATLVKRLGSAADVASAVVYLVDMTDFVTGHVLVVDGGRLIA